MSAVERGAVVVTGAHGQVGSAVARRLRGRAQLALIDREASPSSAESHAEEAHFSADLADEPGVEAVAQAIRARFGGVRALVHTVGGYAGGVRAEAQPLSELRRLLELNFVSAVSTLKAFLPDVTAATDGRIVLFASAAALRASPGSAAYAASKAALLRYAEAVAEEVASRGVRVAVIAPTTIDTPANRKAMPNGRFADWVTPDQIAETVAFLLEPGASGLGFAVIAMGR